MNLSVIGGGSWGSTLAQVLTDNGHSVLVYDINPVYVDKINHQKHPFFDEPLKDIKATNNLKEALEFSDLILLSVPTKAMRDVLKEINSLINSKKSFVNVSKGIEPETLKRVSEIVKEEINPENLENYAVLTGPSHAEEVILRKLTLLTSASDNPEFAKQIQCIFSNDTYLRVYTSSDLIGCEVGGAVKNAIAVVSGILSGHGLGENARAALITRGILEIIRVVKVMGGKTETAFGLTGIGDLIVTASSENSRNFTAGKKIGSGINASKAVEESVQTVEGIRTIQAMHLLSIEKNIELPIIDIAYDVIFNNLSVEQAVAHLLTRDLKEEKLD
ncbi:Glycerol-3-phosphate dehydrogenase [Alteracholeplasma palmae J233]|uniref:Glycerol-3-phosphate dehydrogenase [NAD(P)+] n=1 Tax=Alteracholeplasma palmae (strain ATCC 49389 / J233) TaxID=1318466 RepID=U4KRM8_ALTPJ|nr:NAD(P)H-dependent glycerol-3-phosphate dehydrogenase [Alteracholeplasma palmae]CCV64306.1 Glycerol-3-phosphate dehydrogenase [Alteracholeplasma palmae J233]